MGQPSISVALFSNFLALHSIFQFQADAQQPSDCNMLRNARLTEHDLSDGLKLLILQEGRFWPASIHSTPLPDVYGIVMEKQRGNRPQIQPRDDILREAVRHLLVLFIAYVH